MFTKSRRARIHHPPRGIQVARAQLKFRSKGPVCPTLRAKPSPKVADLCCRFPLPTLFYGPEAAHTGDLMRLWVRTGARVSLAVNLSRTKEACRTPCKRPSALPTSQPYLQAIRFQGKRRLRGWTSTAFSSQGMSCDGALLPCVPRRFLIIPVRHKCTVHHVKQKTMCGLHLTMWYETSSAAFGCVEAIAWHVAA